MFFKYLWSKIPIHRAKTNEKIKFRYSLAYAFIGWNGIIYIFYKFYMENMPSNREERNAVLMSKVASPRAEICQVIRFDGLTLVEDKEYEIDRGNKSNEETVNVIKHKETV